MINHVYIMSEIPAKVSISKVVEFVKGKKCNSDNSKLGKRVKKLLRRNLWEREGCVTTVGLDEEIVRSYYGIKKKRISVWIRLICA